MNFKLTVRRRLDNGELETCTYNLVHVHSSGDDEEQASLLVDMELQANQANAILLGAEPSERSTVRVWLSNDDGDELGEQQAE